MLFYNWAFLFFQSGRLKINTDEILSFTYLIFIEWKKQASSVHIRDISSKVSKGAWSKTINDPQNSKCGNTFCVPSITVSYFGNVFLSSTAKKFLSCSWVKLRGSQNMTGSSGGSTCIWFSWYLKDAREVNILFPSPFNMLQPGPSLWTSMDPSHLH